MFRLIAARLERLLPKPLHRLALRAAHRIRHRYRQLAKPELSGVCAVLRDAEGRVLLVRHHYGPASWSLPGGGLKRGEDPATAIRREIREELGVELVDLELLSTLEEELSGTRHTAYVFGGRGDGAVRPDGREIAKARYFVADELPRDLGRVARSRLRALALD